MVTNLLPADSQQSLHPRGALGTPQDAKFGSLPNEDVRDVKIVILEHRDVANFVAITAFERNVRHKITSSQICEAEELYWELT